MNKTFIYRLFSSLSLSFLVFKHSLWVNPAYAEHMRNKMLRVDWKYFTKSLIAGVAFTTVCESGAKRAVELKFYTSTRAEADSILIRHVRFIFRQTLKPSSRAFRELHPSQEVDNFPSSWKLFRKAQVTATFQRPKWQHWHPHRWTSSRNHGKSQVWMWVRKCTIMRYAIVCDAMWLFTLIHSPSLQLNSFSTRSSSNIPIIKQSLRALKTFRCRSWRWALIGNRLSNLCFGLMWKCCYEREENL